MNYRLTERDIKENNRVIIAAGYCTLQNLLHYENRIGYTASNTYGWKSDIYQVRPNVAISTGYGPLGTHVEYNKLQEYNSKAQKIIREYIIKDHDLMEVKLKELLKEFVDYAVDYIDNLKNKKNK